MPRGLDSRIFDLYESLTHSERRLANVVLEHQRDLASYTATELARRAGVSKATAARLFRRLGYRRFTDAREEARALGHWGSPLNTLYEANDISQDEASLLLHLNNDLANLTRTFEGLPREAIAGSVAALENAQRIWVLGLRGSFIMAHYARFLMVILKPDVRLIPVGGFSFAEEMASMTAQDVLLAIGFRRRPRILKALIDNAHKRGVKVILVTDLSASLTSKNADFVLRCHSRGAYFTDSYAAVMSVLNYIASMLAYRMGDMAKRRIDFIDELHDELDAFSVPGASP